MRSTKKTVSLFQSHVFKHEFFLFPVPSESNFMFPFALFISKIFPQIVTEFSNG
jgi:hypothetical protein